ncbi:uncharacterized protein [Dermacentor andersoni]|uniref:uncharacterized protein n=1 Tax=Dermacentor andersoni TaxID=34620 RepID=UPI003B3AF35F
MTLKRVIGKAVADTKVIRGLPHVRAIYALPTEVEEDQLGCLRADLTTYNASAGKASYFWSWIDGTGNMKSVTYYISKGDSPDVTIVVPSSDPEQPFLTILPYAAEKACFVMKTAELQEQRLGGIISKVLSDDATVPRKPKEDDVMSVYEGLMEKLSGLKQQLFVDLAS